MTGINGHSFEHRIRNLPCWAGPITIAPLKGGLSNETFVVDDPMGKHVVRFGIDFPFHHVLREREVMVARAAHAAGVAPQVEYAQPGIMVSAFLNARTYDNEAVRQNRARIASLIRRFHQHVGRHASGPGFMFWVFHVIRDYARTLESTKSRMAQECPFYLALAEDLEEVQVPLPIIFGHNDLLPANILDDGDRLWLIDFEYAGFNTAMFDIAGLASNAEMKTDEAHELICNYFGQEPDRLTMRAYAAMQCASLLREAMWSMVSEMHLPATGIDYVEYTTLNLEKLRGALDLYESKYGKLQ